jgi:hypothetical protein
MRPRCRVVIGAVLALAAVLAAAPAVADEVTKYYVSQVLESFDQPGKITWRVNTSDGLRAPPGIPDLHFIKAWPSQVYGTNKENANLWAMAIHGGFNRKAYNYIEIVPVDPSKKGADGLPEPKPIAIPGRVQTIDLWVWGSNYNYWLDIHLQDYRGVDHVLHLGSLQYAGWRDLSVTVPGSIPQASPYIPRYRGLVITKLVLWTRPDAPVDDFYVFLDDLKVLTDKWETRFDGDELADPDTLNALWAAGKK